MSWLVTRDTDWLASKLGLHESLASELYVIPFPINLHMHLSLDQKARRYRVS